MRDRRKDKRVQPDGEVVGTVKAHVPAKVLDFSPGGMQVELVSPLPPNTECAVCLPVEDEEIRVRARVRRCRAITLSKAQGEDRGVVYRAGLEFIGLADEDCRRIEDAILEQTLSEATDPDPEDPNSKPHGPIKIRVDTGD